MPTPTATHEPASMSVEETTLLYGVSSCPDCHLLVSPHEPHDCKGRFDLMKPPDVR